VDQKQAWENEYHQQRIESSYSLQPERCVPWFLTFLARAGLRNGRLLDLGCGRGRNSLPFLQAGWSVTGLDFVAAALRDFRRAAGGFRKPRLVQGDLARPLPFREGAFDAALEITAADNLTAVRIRGRFWREVARVLKPGGWFLSYHFTPADGYYGPLLQKSPARERGLLYDRRAGLRFRFYRAEEIAAASRGRLILHAARHYRYPGPMFGRVWQRDLTAAIFQRTTTEGR